MVRYLCSATQIDESMDIRWENFDIPRAVARAIGEHLRELASGQKGAGLRVVLKKDDDQVAGGLYLARSERREQVVGHAPPRRCRSTLVDHERQPAIALAVEVDARTVRPCAYPANATAFELFEEFVGSKGIGLV